MQSSTESENQFHGLWVAATGILFNFLSLPSKLQPSKAQGLVLLLWLLNIFALGI
jgi:hypothetical protein